MLKLGLGHLLAVAAALFGKYLLAGGDLLSKLDEAVRDGKRLSEPLSKGGFIPEQILAMLTVAETLRDVAGLKEPVQYQVSEDRHYLTDNPQRRCPDLARIRTLGPYEPKVNLREGLGRTFRSYQEDMR